MNYSVYVPVRGVMILGVEAKSPGDAKVRALQLCDGNPAFEIPPENAWGRDAMFCLDEIDDSQTGISVQLAVAE